MQSQQSIPTAPITVLIPAFNAAPFIERTLSMLALQTLRPAEIIVVDDASTDDTAAIAERMLVRVIRAPHGGISATRNVGIQAASNPWIALLDADDVWDPRKLELQWEVCRTNSNVELIGTDYDMVDTAGAVMLANSVRNLRQYRYLVETMLNANAALLSTELLAKSIAEWGLFLPSTVLISRSLCERLGGFDVNVEAEDCEFFLRCVAAGKAAMVERSLVGYVQHPGQVTAKWSRQSAMLGLCERVVAEPQRYHPRSIAVFENLMPMLLMRHAHVLATRGEYSRALREVARGLRALCSPAVALAIGLRLGARHPLTLPLLRAFPPLRAALAMTPGRLVAREEHGRLAPWSAIMKASNDGRNAPDGQEVPAAT